MHLTYTGTEGQTYNKFVKWKTCNEMYNIAIIQFIKKFCGLDFIFKKSNTGENLILNTGFLSNQYYLEVHHSSGKCRQLYSSTQEQQPEKIEQPDQLSTNNAVP